MTIAATLHRAIIAGLENRQEMSEVHISEKAAWELSGEMAMMLIHPRKPSEIYESMKAGDCKFMGLKITVAAD